MHVLITNRGETTTMNTQNKLNPDFGITEFRRRIREIGKVVRSVDSIPVNSVVEIHQRVRPVAYMHRPTDVEAFPPNDDLVEYMTPNDNAKWLSEAGVMQHGAVVHVAYSHAGTWGMHELINVFTVWMGTPTEEPVIINAPACRMPPGHGPAVDTAVTV
jgi:hypothetical protein